MLAVGSVAPDFTLADHQGREVRLADLLASGPLVVFFYPGDFTPACSAQACLFRDMHELTTRAGLQVVGINPGARGLHALFHGTLRLPYLLLSDPGRRVTRAYDAMGLMGLMPRRVTYLVSKEGVIVDAVEASLRLSKHREFMERAIARGGTTGGGHAPSARPTASPR